MNPSAELISIIVTNYNHAKYLDQRMESLLAQTYPNLEIIIIDNCSTDNSLDVLAKYKERPHVKIVALQGNIGNINTSNMGVGMSRGEFFMFAEADDYSAPEEIELLYQAMAPHETIGAAFCRSYMVDAAGKVFGQDFDSGRRDFKKFCAGDVLIPGAMAQRFFLYSCIIPNYSAVLFRRSYYDLAGGMSHRYKTCADWDFWFRMVRHSDLYYLATPLNYFRRHAQATGSIYGIQLTLTEIMDLLYSTSRRISMTWGERLRFKVNLGVIWGRYRKPDPQAWWKTFPAVWRRSLRHDKLSVIYLVLAFFKRSVQRMIKMA